MPYTIALMDEEDWAVGLYPDTPSTVLADIDQRLYAGASIIITPQWYRVGDITAAETLAMASYVGRYRKQSDNRLNLEGAGLSSWLGDSTSGGDVFVGTPATSSAFDLEDQLDARVFGNSNGLTKGTINSDATTETMKVEPGTTRLSFLDTICAIYDQAYEWRINYTGTIDVDVATTLWPTNTTPTVILTQEGGREGPITGVRAELDIASIDSEDWLSNVRVRWNTTPGDDGLASNTPPVTWTNFDGSADPVERELIDFSPKQPFKERPNKSLRFNADAYATWALNTATQATRLATAHANKADDYAIEITATIDEYDPTRFVTAGDKVYVYDQDLDIVNNANEVYYRGVAVHPQAHRVQRMTCPIQEGNGIYLRRFDGATFSLYDLTQWVEPEEDETQIELGTRRAFTKAPARPARINKKKFLAKQRQNYRLMKYLETQR